MFVVILLDQIVYCLDTSLHGEEPELASGVAEVSN
jgi:hypothetical protein